MFTSTEPRLWRNSCERVLVHYLAEVYGLGAVSFIGDLREELTGYYHVLFMKADRMNEFVDQYLTSAGLDVRYLDRPLRRADLESVRADAAILWDAEPGSYESDAVPFGVPRLDYLYYLDGGGIPPPDDRWRRLDRRSFPPNVSEALLTRDYKRVNQGRTVIGLLCGRATPAYFTLATETLRRLDRHRFTPMVMQYDDKFCTPEYLEALRQGIELRNLMLCPYRVGAVREALRYTAMVVTDDYRIQAEAGLLSQPVITGPKTYNELIAKLDQLSKDRRQLERLVHDSRLLGSRRSLEVTIPRLEKLLR